MTPALTRVKGDTWVLEAGELIPLYRLDSTRCVLLDSGLGRERALLAAALEQHRLVPAGVLVTHAHRDHLGSAFDWQGRYGCPVAMPWGEAALCRTPLLLKSAYDASTPAQLLEDYGFMLGRADVELGPEDGEFLFCGVPFGVIHTPGHTPDHVCFTTPDGVLYLGDALMTPALLALAKLPYHGHHHQALESLGRLERLAVDACILAHRSVEGDLAGLIAANRALLAEKYRAVLDLLTGSMTQEDLLRAVLDRFHLHTTQPTKAARYARNTRTILEYLVDTGQVATSLQRGICHYTRGA